MNDKTSRHILFANEAAITDYAPREVKKAADISALYLGEGFNAGDVGIYSVYGGLGNNTLEWCFTSYSDITSQLEKFKNDDSIKGIVLAIDSPGGVANGLIDCCEYIKSVAAQKPVYAFIDGMACSAAYAIATACSKVFIKKGSETGCCGCYAEAIEIKDETYEKAGFLHRVFRSANAPKKSLSVIQDKQAGEEFQAQIDALGEEYLNLVATNRCVDPEKAKTSFGQGRVVSAEYALENGMVDRICTVEEMITNLKSSLKAESEGEDMDIKAMSAQEVMEALSDEQKDAIKASLGTSDPALTAEREQEVRKSERDRLKGLEALRNGSEAVDALVNAAVEDGRDANAIGLEVAQLVIAEQKSQKASANDTGKAILEKLAEATDHVVAQQVTELSEDDAINLINGSTK